MTARTIADLAPRTEGSLPLVPTVTLDGLTDIAEAIASRNASIVAAAGTGADRSYRIMRTSEILEIAGVNDRQLRAWRQKNRHTIASVKSTETESVDPNFVQMPLTLQEIHQMMEDLEVRPRRPEGSRAIRLGVFNFKGGSTKTSTTLNLGTYFALKGWRTLLIDADPQGSLTSMFSLQPEDVADEYTLVPALAASGDLGNASKIELHPLLTHVDGLHLVPSNLEMIGADFKISEAFMRNQVRASGFYRVVSRAFEAIQEHYDIILVDGAPSFSFSTLAAIWAVDGMIVPVPPSAPDFKATSSFLAMTADSMDALCRNAGVPEREWAPFLVLHNRVKPRSSEGIMTLARDCFGRYRIDDVVPDASAVPNALAAQMSVFEATSAIADARGLKAARVAYSAIGERIVKAILDAWAAGFAREGQSW